MTSNTSSSSSSRGAVSRRSSNRRRPSPRPLSCSSHTTGNGRGAASRAWKRPGRGATRWASRCTTSRSWDTRSGCANTTNVESARRRPPKIKATEAVAAVDAVGGGGLAVCRDVVEDLQHEPYGHAGATLGPVAGGLTGVVRRTGDVDVRPPEPVGDELAQECGALKHVPGPIHSRVDLRD